MSKADSQGKTAGADDVGSLPAIVQRAARAAQDKKAFDVAVLDVRGVSSFTDYFLICSGQNLRQVKAVADAIEEALVEARETPAHVEGYERADWVLLDYFDFVVHVFTPATREFYALERLWGNATRIDVPAPAPRPSGSAR